MSTCLASENRRAVRIILLGLFAATALADVPLQAQISPADARANAPVFSGMPIGKTNVIIDTDVGDDVDDAFALGLALSSPELNILGITTAWGDTRLRARLVDRLLLETHRAEIPVAEGIPTEAKNRFTQARWAENGPAAKAHPQAVDFLLKQLEKNGGEITLIAIGPLTNIGAAIARAPATFKKVQRVVIMGGSIRRHYDDLGYTPDRGPEPEYNIYSDVAAAQKLFTSGVPIFMMPLDSTQLQLDEVKRAILFSAGTPLTDALTLLYHEWGRQTPILFDAMAVAYAVAPGLCPVEALHIEVDKEGYTRSTSGAPNASACLNSDSERFFHFLLPRLMKSQ